MKTHALRRIGTTRYADQIEDGFAATTRLELPATCPVRGSRRALRAVALTVAVFEVIDAFFLEVPFTAIALAVLLSPPPSGYGGPGSVPCV